MVELLENEARVLKALRDLGGKSTPEELAKHTRLADAAVARAVLTLSNMGLIREQVTKRTELFCTEEGRVSTSKGLPERRVLAVFPENGGRMPIDAAVEKAGLDHKFIPIVTGWITRKGWGKIDREASGLHLTVERRPAKDDDEELVEKIDGKSLILEELPESLQKAAQRLLKRSILESKSRSDRTLQITQPGLEAVPGEIPRGEVSSLTGDMIASGEWQRVRLRSYNVS